MPTPSPIIETRIGVIVLMSVRPAMMNRRRNAVASAVIASAIGISIATNVRKTKRSTMIAASKPSASSVPCSIGGNSASPLYSTVTPTAATASRAASSTATTASRSFGSIVSLNWASAYAMRPLSENVSLLNGSATLSRPASSSVGLNSDDFSRVIARSTAAFRSGVSRRSPSGAAKTMFSTPPCSDANSALIRSVAFCVSDPGISNSSRSEPPTVKTRAISTPTMARKPNTTRHGCVAQARVQRASPPVERRSWAARRSVVGPAISASSPS